MSALNVFVAPNVIHVFSDAAYLNDTQTIEGLGNKVFPIVGENFYAITSATGPYWVAKIIDNTITGKRFDTIDDLVKKFSGIVRDAQREFESARPNFGFGHFRAVVAALSTDGGKPVCVKLSSRDEGGIEAYRTSTTEEYRNPNIPGFAFDYAHPERSGVELVSAQRARLFGDAAAPSAARVGAHMVGGWVQHTRVKRDGIDTRVIHRFPDRIGAKIRPIHAATQTEPALGRQPT